MSKEILMWLRPASTKSSSFRDRVNAFVVIAIVSRPGDVNGDGKESVAMVMVMMVMAVMEMAMVTVMD